MKVKSLNDLNIAQCPDCKDVLISLHVHDFVVCTCWRESCQKQDEYKGKIYTKKGQYTKTYLAFLRTLTGIALDGGAEYSRWLWKGSRPPIKLIVTPVKM